MRGDLSLDVFVGVATASSVTGNHNYGVRRTDLDHRKNQPCLILRHGFDIIPSLQNGGRLACAFFNNFTVENVWGRVFNCQMMSERLKIPNLLLILLSFYFPGRLFRSLATHENYQFRFGSLYFQKLYFTTPFVTISH